jgi:hypothetical protein
MWILNFTVSVKLRVHMATDLEKLSCFTFFEISEVEVQHHTFLNFSLDTG